MIINSNTQLFCIFGNPVRHSLSPVMHNRAFSETGFNGVYLAFQPDSIHEAVTAMRTLGIRGASVTIPFKINVMSCADRIDPLAAKIGSANTLLNHEGMITAYNTDGYGAIAALQEKGVSLDGRRCLIIGSGGSARAIAFTLLMQGASVVIAGIDVESTRSLTFDLMSAGSAEAIHPDRFDAQFLSNIDIIVNTTPVGMKPDYEGIPIQPELLNGKHVVFDIVYSPLKTRLLQEAEIRGCTTVSGISMLLYQGTRQFEIWTGIPAPVSAMNESLLSSIGHS